jgi:hypothetical protein
MIRKQKILNFYQGILLYDPMLLTQIVRLKSYYKVEYTWMLLTLHNIHIYTTQTSNTSMGCIWSLPNSGGNSPYVSSFSNPQEDGNCSNCSLFKIHQHSEQNQLEIPETRRNSGQMIQSGNNEVDNSALVYIVTYKC